MSSDEEMDLNLQGKLIQVGRDWSLGKGICLLLRLFCLVLHIYYHSASRRRYKGWGKDFHEDSSATRKKKVYPCSENTQMHLV